MKRMAANQISIPDWAGRIEKLRRKLKLSQAALGQQMHYSAMAVSRWERGIQEPLADGYIKLGELADNDCWYFWERAGLKSSDVRRALATEKKISLKLEFPDFEVVVAGSDARAHASKKPRLVAIPLLGVYAGAHGEKGEGIFDLSLAPTEEMIAAPEAWCPSPATTRCLKVKGMSMRPLIHDGDIVAVDYSQTNHSALVGKIVVAWHRDKGLCVSRFRRYRDVELLEAENRDYEAVPLASDRTWHIVGKILWWTRLAP